MELAGFRRITLKPGEQKKVTFTLQMSQTAFLDQELLWKVEEGDMDVLVGSSSQDIRLRDSFRITGSCHVDGRNRGFYAESRVEES